MLDGMEKINLINNVAPLRNVMLLGALIRKVQSRSEGMPGMACFHGFSGYGKSQAALYNTQTTNACWVEVKSVWTRKDLCLKICRSLDIPAGRTVSECVEKIGEELVKSSRPLLLDEAHILCKDGMMMLVHDLYESSHGVSIILIGEEMLPQSLTRWERVHNRMLDWVGAQPADLREVGVLAKLKCPNLTLHEQVLEKVLIESKAVARRVVSNLNQIMDFARTEGVSDIAEMHISQIRWITGEAPTARREHG